MNPHVFADPHPVERDPNQGLEAHLQSCVTALGPGFVVECFAEAVHAVVAPRFVTTIFVSSLVLLGFTLAF